EGREIPVPSIQPLFAWQNWSPKVTRVSMVSAKEPSSVSFANLCITQFLPRDCRLKPDRWSCLCLPKGLDPFAGRFLFDFYPDRPLLQRLQIGIQQDVP